MKQGFLIFNPTSGTAVKSKPVVASVLRQFQRRGLDLTPSPTEPDGNVTLQVRELLTQSPDLIVAWGGDGTINEIVNGMFGSAVPLGIIPGGTANLLARELKLSRRPPDSIRIIAQGQTKKISVGQANNRYFLLMVGIGFDSAVIRNVDRSLKRRFGKFAFGVSALNTARSYEYPRFKVKTPEREEECVFAVICNAKEYAAYFILTPLADIFDEYFHVCLFKDSGFGNMSRYVMHALRRQHDKLQSVELFRTTELEVTGPSEIAVQADGELIGYLPMKFQIHPRSLTIFCP